MGREYRPITLSRSARDKRPSPPREVRERERTVVGDNRNRVQRKCPAKGLTLTSRGDASMLEVGGKRDGDEACTT